MLKTKKMSSKFWGEAVATAAYILDRCPTKMLQGVTPEEAWSGKKPSVSHLRIFGSLCFKHVPEQLRKKLDDKAEQMVLLGYHSTGAYKLFDPRRNKVFFSRDVMVDESKSWNWELSSDQDNKKCFNEF